MNKLATLILVTSIMGGISGMADASSPAMQGLSRFNYLVNYNTMTGSLPSGLTLTRASNGTYFNSSGVLSTASTNAARYDYNPATLALRGILIEPQATNLIQRSDAVNAGWWTANQSPSIGGGTANLSGGTAQTISFGTNANSGYYGLVTGLSNGSNYTYSGYFKNVSGNATVRFGSDDSVYGTGAQKAYIEFNSSTGSITNTQAGVIFASVTAVETGWFRAIVTAKLATGTATGPIVYHGTNSGVGETGFFGLQMELGSTATSSIATAGGVATRAADAYAFTIPANVTSLQYTTDLNTAQNIAVSAGAYTVPTNLTRPWVSRIRSLPR